MKPQQDSASSCSPMGASFGSALVEPSLFHDTDSISKEKATAAWGPPCPWPCVPASPRLPALYLG